MPARQEAGKGDLLDRLDLLAKRGERSAADPAEHVGVAPLPLGPARPKLAADEPVLALQHHQLGFRALGVDAEPLRRLPVVNGPRPRAYRASSERRGSSVRSRNASGQAARRHRAERVAVPARILGGDQPLLAGDADP